MTDDKPKCPLCNNPMVLVTIGSKGFAWTCDCIKDDCEVAQKKGEAE